MVGIATFRGLSAFPLTPHRDGLPDMEAFGRIIERVNHSGIDSIGALGSTGSYPYLTVEERRELAQVAVQHAGDTPVILGVGGVSTREILRNVDAATDAGVHGLLVSVLTYQSLTDTEVFDVFRAVSDATDIPIVIYDNPGTTGFTYSTELYARICELPGVASIKIPGVPADHVAAKRHVDAIRAVIPEHVTIGVSGDWMATGGIEAGCDAWYSVLAGTFPEVCVNLMRNRELHEPLEPLWDLFRTHGSYRVISALAHETGLTDHDPVYAPVQPLTGEARATVRRAIPLVHADF